MSKVFDWLFTFWFMLLFRTFQAGVLSAGVALAGMLLLKRPYLQLLTWMWASLFGLLVLMQVIKTLRKSWHNDQ